MRGTLARYASDVLKVVTSVSREPEAALARILLQDPG
jgi:hypothetical protein